MSAEENKATVLRYFEESHNRHNLDVIDELCVPEYAEVHKQWQSMERAALPDKHFTIEDVVAEGDRLLVRWTIRGTHHGDFWTPLGVIAPTGRQIEFRSQILYGLEDGKIAQEWHYIDWLDLLHQFGAEVRLENVEVRNEAAVDST